MRVGTPLGLRQRFQVSIVWDDGRALTQLVRAASKAVAWRWAWEQAGDPEDTGGIASVRVIPAA